MALLQCNALWQPLRLTRMPTQTMIAADQTRSTMPTAPKAKLRPRRLLVTLITASLLGALFTLPSNFPAQVVVGRTVIAGLIVLLAFSATEVWPRTLPWRFPRWLWQLLGILLVAPPAAFFAYSLTTGGDPQFADPDRFESAAVLAGFGALISIWVGLVGIVSQREALAREQALALELAHSDLARLEADARWRLLQAQTTPHFLFNTLANVQALVDLGSPDASALLSSLVNYLRAAVPHAGRSTSTVGQEVEMARAYLEIMRIRMPDRLRYEMRVDPAAETLACPSMALLTLIENAVRHGIDPSEEGGLIEVDVALGEKRCHLRVRNPISTHAAGSLSPPGLGTGIEALRERLSLSFGEHATLRTGIGADRHFVAEILFPGAP